ncbi:MAG: hypothetical protein DPW09_09970 [Anaerolineae bacterium]|nr:hypothetical protein [Anaerolineae bacterium]
MALMPEFVFLIRGGEENPQDFSLQELQVHVNKYFAWIEELTQAGHFKSGQPLAAQGKVVSRPAKDKVSIKDGPFAESKEAIQGFFLIQANDLNQAVELAQGCPVLDLGGGVEVRPIAVEIAQGLKEKME